MRVGGFFVAGIGFRREKQILVVFLERGVLIVNFSDRVELILEKAKLWLFRCYNLI